MQLQGALHSPAVQQKRVPARVRSFFRCRAADRHSNTSGSSSSSDTDFAAHHAAGQDEATAAQGSSRNGHAEATQQQQQQPGVAPTSSQSSNRNSILRSFPPKKQKRPLDVNRAVALLKLTAWRSDRKNTTKLPPWFTRTQDEIPETWYDEPPGSSTNSVHGTAGQHDSSGRGKPLYAIDTLDDVSTASTSSSTGSSDDALGSRWRSGSPGYSNSSSSSGTGASNMFSASDPIRRGRQTQSEWHLLPWQEGGDAAKEDERKFRRAVFSFDRWAAHRSTWRYLRHFRGLFSSRTLQGLLPAVAFFTGMAALAGAYNTLGVEAGAPSFTLNSSALDITAFAVSLLLVFRTDSSYARWEEALKTWNEVRSLSKDLARQSCYWVNETARKEMLIRWCEAFSRALLVHCRVDGSLEGELEDVLQPHEVAAVAAVGSGGAPSFVLQVISELVEQCGVSDIKEDKMFSTLRSLGDTIAVCDKLLRYPLPLAWSRHTSRFMFLWLSALPWSMWPDSQWGVIPITAVISYLLLGIDEIGVQIEEPFGILPLEDVCVDIQSEIEAMMERQDIVTDLLVAGGVDCEPRSTCGACGAPMPAAAAAVTAANTSAAQGIAAAFAASAGVDGNGASAVGAGGCSGGGASVAAGSGSSNTGGESPSTQ